MDDMLRVLMDMDAAARKRTNEVEAMKEDNQSKLSAQKSEIIDEKLKGAQERADKEAARIADEAQKKIEEIKDASKKAFSDMEKLAGEKQKQWVDEIVARALSN